MTKRWKRHSPGQIVRKLGDADAMLNAVAGLSHKRDQRIVARELPLVHSLLKLNPTRPDADPPPD